MEINPTLPAANNGGAPTKSEARLAETFNQFLTLLTTQLKHQDPLDPMDSSEFVNQLVQFSEVEQSISTNQKLEDIFNLQTRNQAMSAVGLMGHMVEASGNKLALVDGNAELTYTLTSDSATTVIGIMNGQDQIVFNAPGNTTAGKHSLTWDGMDINGNKLPDGEYKIFVAARDAEEAQIKVTTGSVARVTGIETTDDGVMLLLGTSAIPFENVRSVREMKSAGSGT